MERGNVRARAANEVTEEGVKLGAHRNLKCFAGDFKIISFAY